METNDNFAENLCASMCICESESFLIKEFGINTENSSVNTRVFNGQTTVNLMN